MTKKIFPITSFLSDISADLGRQSLPPSPQPDPTIRRLVIVGDVHGMRKSLEALLDKVNFNQQQGDHLILVGDLVNKGPDSPGVVDLAIKLGASAVRGNHDNAVLDAAAEMKAARDSLLQSGDLTRNQAVAENPQADQLSDLDTAVTSNGERHSEATQKTATELSTGQLDWLASLPLILRVNLPDHLKSSLGETLVVVHAGLVPNVPLTEQDPHTIMHMRSLIRTLGEEDGFIPAETMGEEGWVVEWNRWQEQQASKTTVIFGHDAKRRLQLGRYTIGLDSGCLYGHQLSAVVIAAPNGEIEHRIVQVECTDAACPISGS
ncbi:hypothetical protein FE257_011102 [Aspergillus nanangensis]|uniref:Calcineurin-like phosphoesterase domain-containing protein n=1 Tax=Aspergillus nanangensis TaxID=2582783 RepID=A0AAD4CHS5_ASPNN|nr:hypothetical protein FE257_011102 [Aspergillus nanangensis]